MRRSVLVFALAWIAGGLVGCAGKDGEKPKDPTDVAASQDEVPKWEGASAPDPEASAPKASGGATVNEAPARRSDQYDKEGTEVVLRRAARQVKDNCGLAKDENGKAVGPWGKVTIQVQLGANGHSKGTSVPAPYQGKPTGNCVEKAFSKLTFPPWAGSDTQVDWEVELVQPSAEGKK